MREVYTFLFHQIYIKVRYTKQREREGWKEGGRDARKYTKNTNIAIKGRQ